jgi:hypothetical protein
MCLLAMCLMAQSARIRGVASWHISVLPVGTMAGDRGFVRVTGRLRPDSGVAGILGGRVMVWASMVDHSELPASAKGVDIFDTLLMVLRWPMTRTYP